MAAKRKARTRGRRRRGGSAAPSRWPPSWSLIPLALTFVYLPSFVHPVSTLMLKDLATFSGYDRRWVSLDDIAPVLAHSVIMSEDGQFCAHHGVDLGELKVVIDDALAGEGARGASTITMQTVKNLYLWHRPLGTLRKVVELPLAVYFDLVRAEAADHGDLSQHRRMGTEHLRHRGRRRSIISAARPRQLTRRQAALLAVTLPNPLARDPAKPGPGLRRLATLIERRAAQGGRLCRLPGSSARRKIAAALVKTGIAVYGHATFSRMLARHAALSRGLPGLFTDRRSTSMAVPKRKTSPSKRGMRRSADALKAPTYVEDKNSGEMRRPHHIDLKTGMYRGRQVLTPKES